MKWWFVNKPMMKQFCSINVPVVVVVAPVVVVCAVVFAVLWPIVVVGAEVVVCSTAKKQWENQLINQSLLYQSGNTDQLNCDSSLGTLSYQLKKTMDANLYANA